MKSQDRLRQLGLLRSLEPVVSCWSIRLGEHDAERVAALRLFLLGLAKVQVGLAREVRRGWIDDMEVILLIDEYAEALHGVRRPALSTTIERQFVEAMTPLLRRGARVSR